MYPVNVKMRYIQSVSLYKAHLCILNCLSISVVHIVHVSYTRKDGNKGGCPPEEP